MEMTTYKTQHVIITMNKGEYFIDEDENTQLKKLGINDLFTTKKGVRLRASTIVEVLPLEEYYRSRPDKRPESSNYHLKNVNDLIPMFNNMTLQRKQKAMKNIIDGFKGHFIGRKIPRQSQIMLDKMIARINRG